MKNKLEMNLLNDEKLHEVMGGVGPNVTNPCSAKGHVIDQYCYANKVILYRLCVTAEAKCGTGGPNAGFTYLCGMGDMACLSDVKFSTTIIADKPSKSYKS